MSDHYCAEIRIGGCLRREHVARLCALLGTDGDGEETLLRRVEDGCLQHEDSQAACGGFFDLEAACRELDLPYVRRSAGCWGTLPRIVFWQPGMEEPRTVLTDSEGNRLVPAEHLLAARALLRSGRSGEALMLLEEAVTEVPELPPFRGIAPGRAGPRVP